jgi:hypothetical protein
MMVASQRSAAYPDDRTTCLTQQQPDGPKHRNSALASYQAVVQLWRWSKAEKGGMRT